MGDFNRGQLHERLQNEQEGPSRREVNRLRAENKRLRECFSREYLFDGWEGCSNRDCIVTGPKKGVATNSTCTCVQDASRVQRSILGQKLNAALANHEQEKE